MTFGWLPTGAPQSPPRDLGARQRLKERVEKARAERESAKQLAQDKLAECKEKHAALRPSRSHRGETAYKTRRRNVQERHLAELHQQLSGDELQPDVQSEKARLRQAYIDEIGIVERTITEAMEFYLEAVADYKLLRGLSTKARVMKDRINNDIGYQKRRLREVRAKLEALA